MKRVLMTSPSDLPLLLGWIRVVGGRIRDRRDPSSLLRRQACDGHLQEAG